MNMLTGGGGRSGWRRSSDAILADADGTAAQPRTALHILPSAPYQPVNVAYRIGIRGRPET